MSSEGLDETLGILEPVGGGDPIQLSKDHLKIGRRESCDICLPYSNVSSRHCELLFVHGYWRVRDLASTNGTKVNGERVIERRVYPGDEIAIAKHRFRLQYTPRAARSADTDVEELHEDIMKFSLLERAGLSSGDPHERRDQRRTDSKPRKPSPDEGTAKEKLNGPDTDDHPDDER